VVFAFFAFCSFLFLFFISLAWGFSPFQNFLMSFALVGAVVSIIYLIIVRSFFGSEERRFASSAVIGVAVTATLGYLWGIALCV